MTKDMNEEYLNSAIYKSYDFFLRTKSYEINEPALLCPFHLLAFFICQNHL